MKLTINQILHSQNALIELQGLNLAVPTAFRLRSLYRKLENIITDYEAERIKLCEKYGKLDTEINEYKFGDNQSKWQKDFDELLLIENDIDFTSLSIIDFRNVESISVRLLNNLDWLIVEEKAEAAKG